MHCFPQWQHSIDSAITAPINRLYPGVWWDYTPATLIGWHKEGLNGQQMEVAGVEGRKVGFQTW